MESDPDKVLNRLVTAALAIFITLIVLLGALVARQLWLQERVADLSSDLEANLADLEEITEEAEQELAETQETAVGPDSGEWAEVSEALSEVDEQLNVIEEGLNELELALESGEMGAPAAGREAGVAPDQVDEVFSVFAILVGVASVAIAILLAAAVSRARSA